MIHFFMGFHFDVIRSDQLMSPLEITLFEGVDFDAVNFSIPTASENGKRTNAPGIKVVGYLSAKSDKQLELCFGNKNANLGKINIYKGAIQNIDFLEIEYEFRDY